MSEFARTVTGPTRSSRAEVDAARLVVAGHAGDVDDLRLLLSVLGLSGTKICTTCREELAIEEFGLSPREPGGRSSWCRTCTRFDQLRRRRQHR